MKVNIVFGSGAIKKMGIVTVMDYDSIILLAGFIRQKRNPGNFDSPKRRERTGGLTLRD
jgi:hypothetical protein